MRHHSIISDLLRLPFSNVRTILTICSPVRLRFSFARSGSIASFSVMGSLRMENNASISGSIAVSASFVTLPPIPMTGTQYFRASRASSMGPFPIEVCPSIRPSPVITRSAPAISFSIPRVRMTSSAPGSSSAPRKAMRDNPSPPAAPAPGLQLKSSPTASSVHLAKFL